MRHIASVVLMLLLSACASPRNFVGNPYGSLTTVALTDAENFIANPYGPPTRVSASLNDAEKEKVPKDCEQVRAKARTELIGMGGDLPVTGKDVIIAGFLIMSEYAAYLEEREADRVFEKCMTSKGWTKQAIPTIKFLIKGGLEMSNRLTLFSLVLGALLFVSGCSNRATATLSPGADLSKVKTFYVVRNRRHTQHPYLISDKLVMSYSATAGPELPQSSYKVDSIVTYVDRWMWDITLYLLELT